MNYGVAKVPRLLHATRRLSCGRIDGVDAMQRRLDAIAATPASSSSVFTLTQHLRVNLFSHFRFNFAGISREERQEALGSRVDHVDLV